MRQIKVLDKIIFINEKNGSFSFKKEDLLDDTQPNISDYIKTFNSKHLTLCINISNSCNLKCKFCFNNKKNDKLLDYVYIEKRILEFVNLFNQCEKYYIDLSGKGEPLLNLSTILKIADFCNALSKKIEKDLIVSFVTNGTLLNKKIIRVLQKKNILFGISLDGPESVHNYFRINKFGAPTYKIIIKNIKKIKKREFLGCAVTLTNKNFDLLQTLLELNNYFETISVKPVRDIKFGFTYEAVISWSSEYERLTKYFIEKIKLNNWILLKKIINGDDYFGKFIYRCFLNLRVLNRCDAGISRFTIEEENKIYGCPAASMYPSFEITSLNPKSQLKKQIFNNNCQKCEFFYFCGGECEIEFYLHNKKNEVMCYFKKKLIALAMYLKLVVLFEYPETFYDIYSFCQEKMNRKLVCKNKL